MLTYTINENKQFNSLELSFNEKPSSTILENLKALKMRWNPKKSIWYGFTTKENIENAIKDNMGKIEPVKHNTKLTDEEEQNKREAAKISASTWSDPEHWEKYYIDKIAYAVKLEDGQFLTIEKPRIETSFCFGYGMYGVSDEEDSKAAFNTMRAYETDSSFFIQDNLKKIEKYIKLLEISINNYNDENKLYEELSAYDYSYRDLKPSYRSKGGPSELSFCSYYNGVLHNHWGHVLDSYKLLSYEDLCKVLEGYKKVKAQFEKRLNTYLKKYGLSKLNTWTYLRD